MTNDVEVVAKAIAESYYGISWDSTEEVDKNVWRKQAHAAIAALGGHELTRVREDIDRTASVVQALGTAIIASRQCHASWHRLEYEAHEQWERLVDLLEQQRAMESPAKPAPQPEQQPGLSHVAAHFADEQGATAPQPEQPQPYGGTTVEDVVASLSSHPMVGIINRDDFVNRIVAGDFAGAAARAKAVEDKS